MQTKTGIIFLQRDKFQIYSPYLANILEFRFVPELIRDFDLINRELLENLLKVFIANNKIPTSSLVIVVSDNASYIRDFVLPPVPNPQQPNTPPPTLEDLQKAAEKYVEYVPFEIVAGKTFPLATGVRAYATNQEIYDAFRSVLEKQGFIIQGVFPGFAFGQEMSNKPVMDAPMVTLILQKLSLIAEYNLLKERSSSIPEVTMPEEVEEKETSTSSVSGGRDNKRITLIVGAVVIGLILVLTGVIVYTQFQEKPYTPPAQPVTQSTSTIPTAIAQTQPSPVELDASELTVKIINASSSATLADSLKTNLNKYGFKSVVIQKQTTLMSGQNILIFSPKVGTQIKTAITDELRSTLGSILVQDKTEAVDDIVITLTK